jgi:hypothetical protein
MRNFFRTTAGPRFGRSYVISSIAAILAIEALLAALFLDPKIQFDNKIGVSLFLAVPAFIIAIAQLIRTQQVQRASYIKDFLTEFRKNNDLYTAYYDLVYRYRDEIYDKVDKIAEQYIANRSAPSADQKPVFDCFDELQISKELGARFFHPRFFQFSPEEKKLDGLLDYFNALGLYLYEGLLDMDDIVTILGDYIAVLADRKIIASYLALCNDSKAWKYDDSVGASPPYRHVTYLLESYQDYNLQEFQRKREKELRDAIEQKRAQVRARRTKAGK